MFFTYPEDAFVKKRIRLEKHNADPHYFTGKVLEHFPELSEFDNVFSLWQIRENKPELMPVSSTINNAKALCDCDEIKRSCVYIKSVVSLNFSLDTVTM